MQHALTSPLAFHSPQILRCGQDLAPPAWVRDLFAVDAQKVLDDDELQRVDADRFTLMTARVRGAAELSPADVEGKTAAAYASIARELSQARSRHAVRFWNH